MKVEDSEAAVQSRGDSVPMLVALGIEKAFDRTRALSGAELDVYPGEVMGLLGANGAGKSTLSKVISGQVIRDAGSITLRGRPLNLRTAREAIQHGITMVMQETSLAPDLSVLENVFLAELGRPGLLSYRRLKRQAEEILDRLGQKETLPLDREVRLLSAAQRQLVEIAKALALNSTLIIFDEPTASLSPPEVERLFQVMTTLKRAGHTLVFVSHRLEEVFAITDRVTVMREGRTVAKSLETGSLSQAELIRLMVGQEMRSTLPAEKNRSARHSPRPDRPGGQEPQFGPRCSRCFFPSASGRNPRVRRTRRSRPFRNRGGDFWATSSTAAESSTSMENGMRPGEPRMRFAPASDSSQRIVAFRELSRTFPFVRTCCWGTWQPLANSDWGILNESSRSMS